MAKDLFRPEYETFDGIILYNYPKQEVREALQYKPKPDDVFIATYPKSGTTWMQSICINIFRKGRELENYNDFHRYSPSIDWMGIKSIEDMPRPGVLKTHFPFTHVPYSPEAKYIYVLRNPKDCCVSSYYHILRNCVAYDDPFRYATFDDFFELFMNGEVVYNDYYDHLMSWYPHIHDKQVLFTTYEDMKSDLKSNVLKVASFLGQEYIEAIEQDNNILNNILRFCAFDYMKQRLSDAFRLPGITEDDEKERGVPCFYRRGVVGDWKNHFSEDQNERMKKKFIDRTEGTEIFDLYKCYMFE